MSERKTLLRATVKLFALFSLLWLCYILIIGLFTDNYTKDRAIHVFDLSNIETGKSAYFSVDRREIIVINTPQNFHIFWADDPIYGCRIELIEDTLRPVCIPLKYQLDGKGLNTSQHLKSPDYTLDESLQLHIRN